MNLTLAWCLNAKHSIANVHGFLPFQLVFGQSPKPPSTFVGKKPPLIKFLQILQQPYIKQDKDLF